MLCVLCVSVAKILRRIGGLKNVLKEITSAPWPVLLLLPHPLAHL